MLRISQLLTLAAMAGLLAGVMYVSGTQTPSDGPATPVLTETGLSSQAGMDDSLSSKPFVLIELFTSEGCSSCPSADKNLEKIAAQAKASGQNIYTLSYHVDYWDYLGWKDPYATKQFSNRQRSYARQFKSSRIYTPQMVVNGKTEFVGSNQKTSQQVIKQALVSKTKSAIAVTSSIKDKTVDVHWKVEGLGQQDQVQVALVQNSGQQKVRRGENARRTLTHVNIVRAHKTITTPGAEGQLKFSLPAGLSADDCHVVAFVQTPKAVAAAAKSKINAPTAGVGSSNKTSSDSTSKNAGNNSMYVSAFKPPVQAQATGRKLMNELQFFAMLSDHNNLAAGIAEAQMNWNISYVPMLLEVARFMPGQDRARVMGLLEFQTGQRFGNDNDKWLQWLWKQKYTPHPGYGAFKSLVYSQLDPRFTEYFVDTKDATIRLDEIRWGGVKRDGIPPLKNPIMLASNNAQYLADTDVVFGIELNGDARAYPKRILAWHEMFKDTIGGESVCGVY